MRAIRRTPGVPAFARDQAERRARPPSIQPLRLGTSAPSIQGRNWNRLKARIDRNNTSQNHFCSTLSSPAALLRVSHSREEEASMKPVLSSRTRGASPLRASPIRVARPRYGSSNCPSNARPNRSRSGSFRKGNARKRPVGASAAARR